MRATVKRAVATAVAVALSLFTVAVYAGTNNADEGSGYDVSFDFDFTEYDRTEETVYTIDIINTIEQPTATPSDATEEPEKPVKPIDGGYSGSDNQEAAEDKITTLPANIENKKIGLIEAHYNKPQPEIPTIPIEPDIPDENGEESGGGLAGLPKTGDNSHPEITLFLFCGSLATMIILLKKKRGKNNENFNN